MPDAELIAKKEAMRAELESAYRTLTEHVNEAGKRIRLEYAGLGLARAGYSWGAIRSDDTGEALTPEEEFELDQRITAPFLDKIANIEAERVPLLAEIDRIKGELAPVLAQINEQLSTEAAEALEAARNAGEPVTTVAAPSAAAGTN